MCPTWILSYRFTGEVLEELSPILNTIQKKLESIGFSQVFCSLILEDFFNENNYSPEERYQYCLKEQEWKDFLVAFIRSEAQSSGMKQELDKALKNKQQILLLIKQGIEEHHPEFISNTHHTIKFETIAWLLNTLNTLDIEAMINTRDSEQ